MRYYTFEIDGQKVGYYEESNENGILSSNARLVMHGEMYENPFGIMHTNGRVTAYRYGNSDWIEFKEQVDVYPTSALPLILPRVNEGEEYEYTQFIEGQGMIGKRAILKSEGEGVVSEYVEGTLMRRVVIREGVIVEYGWGGSAKSVLCESRTEAIKGTRWE